MDATYDFSALLAPLKRAGALQDYEVGETSLTTWESLYPAMPLRLLAIEADERFGSEIISDTATRPLELVGYPYRYRCNYRICGVDADGTYWTEWEFDTGESAEETAARYTREGLDPPTVETVHSWQLETPGKLLVDVYLTPTRPLEYIAFEAHFTNAVAELFGG